jgi:hypothetical protein
MQTQRRKESSAASGPIPIITATKRIALAKRKVLAGIGFPTDTTLMGKGFSISLLT